MKNRLMAALAVAFVSISLAGCSATDFKNGLKQLSDTVTEAWDTFNTGVNYALGQVPALCAAAADFDSKFQASRSYIKYPGDIVIAEAKGIAALYGSPNTPCNKYPTTLQEAIAAFKPAYKAFRDAQASATNFANSQ